MERQEIKVITPYAPKINLYSTVYKEYHWKDILYRSGRMRDIIKRTKAAGLHLPPSPRGAQKEACPSYDIKDFYNARCRWSGEHHPYPTGGDQALREWSRQEVLGSKREGGWRQMKPLLRSRPRRH